MSTKKCSRCKQEKPLSRFCRNKWRLDGYNHYCKSCVKEYRKYNCSKKESSKEEVLCQCGCKGVISPFNQWGKPRQYIRGHNCRVRKMSKEHCRKISEKARKRFKDPIVREAFAMVNVGRILTEEHKAKIGQANSGENSGLYVDGSRCNGAVPSYHPNFTEEFRESVRERDGRICQLCGVSEEETGERLSVHHCDYDRNNPCNDNTDFVALCQPCHIKTNYRRAYYIKYFTGVLKEYCLTSKHSILNNNRRE